MLLCVYCSQGVCPSYSPQSQTAKFANLKSYSPYLQDVSQDEEEEQQSGGAEDASPQVDLEEAEEGWEDSDILDLPPQASEAPESAQDESPTEVCCCACFDVNCICLASLQKP